MHECNKLDEKDLAMYYEKLFREQFFEDSLYYGCKILPVFQRVL